MTVVIGTNAGFVTTAPTADPEGNNTSLGGRAQALKVVAPDNITIKEIGVWVDNATNEADMELGIYNHDSGDDEPGTLVTSELFSKGTTAGWKKVVGLNIELSSGVTYWIAAQMDYPGAVTYQNYSADTGERRAYKLSQTTLTDPWGDSQSNLDNYNYSIYAVYTTTIPPVTLPERPGTAGIRGKGWHYVQQNKVSQRRIYDRARGIG